MTSYYSANFDAETVGAIASGWTGIAGTWQVGTVNPVTSPRTFGDTVPVNLNSAIYTSLSPSRSDIDFSAVFKAVFSGADAHFPSPILRSDATGDNCYKFVWNAATLYLFKRVAGTHTQLATTTMFPMVNGGRYYFRARAEGTALKIRFWRYGHAEPSTWFWEQTDGAVTAAGTFGLHVLASGTPGAAAVDNVLVESPTSTPIATPAQVGPVYGEFPIELLDAAAITGKVPTDAVSHTDIPDQSGSSNDPTASNAATYQTVSGVPVVRMDGANDNFTGAPTTPIGSHYSKVMVIRVTNTGAVSYARGGASGTGHSLYFASTNKPRLYFNGDALVSSVGVTQDAFAIVVGVVTFTDAASEDDASFALCVSGVPGGVSPYTSRLKVNDDTANFIGAQGVTVGSRFDWGKSLTYLSPLSAGDINQIGTDYGSEYGVTVPTLIRQITFIGDSLTSGAITTSGNSYVERLQTALTTTWCGVRFSAAGMLLSEMVTAPIAENVDNSFSTYVAKNVLVVWGYTNDNAAGVAAATSYALLQAFCAARKAAALASGITLRIVVIGMLPRGADAAVETRRLTWNALLAANTTDWDGVLVTPTSIFNPGSQSNATNYDADTIHLNDTGHGLLKGTLQTMIEALSFPAAAGGGSSFGSSFPPSSFRVSSFATHSMEGD